MRPVATLKKYHTGRKAFAITNPNSFVLLTRMPTLNYRIILGCGILCLWLAIQAQRQRLSGELNYAMDVIDFLYVKPVDRDALYMAAMKGMVDSLDPYSSYIPPQQFEQFNRQITQEFGGLGIIIEGPTRIPDLTIVSPIYGSPAWEAGIVPGDVIVNVEGESIVGLDVETVSERLQGPKGSTVQFDIRRGEQDELISFEIVRDTIELESVAGDRRLPDGRWIYTLESEPSIAYLRLSSFGDKSAEELRVALQQVVGSTDGIVLDLRNNAGGLLNKAAEICDMFLDEGLIVKVVGRDGVEQDQINATPGTLVPKEIPLVVLVNHNSASASEIVAACLQDHARATIVGTRSFGKGSVQSVIGLGKGNSAMRLTTARYYSMSNRKIHREIDEDESGIWGVSPSEENTIELTEEQEIEVFERMRQRSDPRNAPKLPSLNDLETNPGVTTTGDEDADDLSDPQLDWAKSVLKRMRSPTNTDEQIEKNEDAPAARDAAA